MGRSHGRLVHIGPGAMGAFHIIRTGDVASKNGTGPELRQGVLFLNYGEDSSGVEMCDTPTRLFMALESHADDYAARMAARST